MRTVVATASDEGFFPLLRGLVGSLTRAKPGLVTALAVFDLGLSAASRSWLQRHAAKIVAPTWDLPVPEAQRGAHPAWRALTVRPFLPRYFPGNDVYLWIDADAWVQRHEVLERYFDAAARGRLAITPERHAAYRFPPGVLAWRTSRMEACFGAGARELAAADAAGYCNAGVFALAAGAPHWGRWAAHFADALAVTGDRFCCDQTALNHALGREDLAVEHLPATCNWLCHLAVPGADVQRGLLCEPTPPSRPLGIVHLTGDAKHRVLRLGGAAGPLVSLRYPGIARPAAAP